MLFPLIFGFVGGSLFGGAIMWDSRRRPWRMPAAYRAWREDVRTPLDISPPVVEDDAAGPDFTPDHVPFVMEPAAVVALERTSGAHAYAADPVADKIYVGMAPVDATLAALVHDSGAVAVLEYGGEAIVGIDESGATAAAVGRLRKAGYVGQHLDESAAPTLRWECGATAEPTSVVDASQPVAWNGDPIPSDEPVLLLFDLLPAPTEALAARTGFEKGNTGVYQIVRPWPDVPGDATFLPIVAAVTPDVEPERAATITVPEPHVRGRRQPRQRINTGAKGGRS